MYNMYNENDKNSYIKFKENSSVLPQNYLTRLFDKTLEYESRYGKDVSNFSVDQIIDMYKSMNIFQVETLTNINSQLSNYTQWCLENSLVNDSQNHFSEFNFQSLKKYVNTSHVNNGIITKEEFMSCVRNLPNESDKFIMLCIFEGIRGIDYSEIRQIMLSDFNGRTLHLQGGRIKELGDHDRYIKVSEDLYNLASAANEELNYEAYSGNTTVTLVDEGFIIKRTLMAYNKGSQGNFYRRVDNILLNIRTQNDNINMTSLRNSGKISYIKERSAELGLTPKEFIFNKKYADELREKFNDSTKYAVFYEKFSNYLDN